MSDMGTYEYIRVWTEALSVVGLPMRFSRVIHLSTCYHGAACSSRAVLECHETISMISSRRMRVRRRPVPITGHDLSGWTLFARLNPALAQQLQDQALTGVGGDDDAPQDGWTATDDTLGPVEFIPLCITFSNGSKIYVSYNGGAPEDGIDQETIDIPDCLMDGDDGCVGLYPLSFVPDAVSLKVEPLSIADWELLEIHADWLEHGGLLGQVSVVYEGQVLCLAVGGRDLVRVKVLLEADQQGDDERVNVPCRRLVADTEVVVLSKPRRPLSSVSQSPPLRVLPTIEDYGSEMRNLADSMSMKPVNVPVGTIYVHSNTLEECGWEEDSLVRVVVSKSSGTSVTDRTSAVIARVKSCNEVPLGHVALHSLLRIQLRAAALFDYVVFEAAVDGLDDDIRFSEELVARGAVRMHLRPVRLVNSTVDSSAPWRYPFEGQHVGRGYGCSDPDDFADEALVHDRLRTWMSINDRHRTVLLQSGSLLDLSCSTSSMPSPSDTCVYELHVVGSKSTAEESLLEFVILAHDLVSLICPYTSKECRILQAADDQCWLNLLPPTPDSQASTREQESSFLPFDGVVLHGDRGSGKTHAALMLAAGRRLANANATVYMDCRKLQSSSNIRMKDTLDALASVFHGAVDTFPSTVILDDLDDLAPNLEFGDGDEESSAQQHQPNPSAIAQSKLIADHVRSLIEYAVEEYGRDRIFVVVTCRDETCLAPSLLQLSGVFLKQRQVKRTSPAERETIFRLMLGQKLSSTLSQYGASTAIRFSGFGRKTEGYLPFDLDLLATRVHRRLLTAVDGDGAVVNRAVGEEMKSFVPLSRQGVRVDSASSDAAWEHVGGLFQVKEQLTETILNPVKYARIYESAPVRLPRGLLLLGPPGCGKSYLVPALAKKCELTLVTCRGPELLDKYIGASEANVRQLFERAYTAAPSLLFLDEFDALAPRRGSDHTGVTDRVVNQLLTFLDGVEVESGKQVYVVGATSRPDKIDPALLRPGRLERHIFVGFPKSDKEWNDVLLKILANRNVDYEVIRAVQSGQLLSSVKEVAPHVELFSPADLKAVVNTAYLQAAHELIDRDEGLDESACVCIGMRHVLTSLRSTRQSLSRSDRHLLDQVYRPFQGYSQGSESLQSNVGNLRTALR